MESIVIEIILCIMQLIQLALPLVFLGLFIGLISTLIIRDDLVTKAIIKNLSPSSTNKKNLIEPTRFWTDVNESLIKVPMLPTIRAKTMINYLQEFKNGQLKPLVKRLEDVEMRFSEIMHMSQRAWTAHK